MIAEAPGKLYIAGEYAVVTPGQPAILVAVDRCIQVRTQPAGGSHARVHSAVYDAPLEWTLDENQRITFHGAPPPAQSLVADTLSVMIEFTLARGMRPTPIDLDIVSMLDSEDGRKFGLGSSAAVVVALVDALGQAWGLDLAPLERFKLALLSTLPSSPRASGGDIAASTLTGWVRYTSPNREWVAAQRHEHGVAAAVSMQWVGLELTKLPTPASVRLTVGWTGAPADTDKQVSNAVAQPVAQDAFIVSSHAAVDRITRGILDNDAQLILEGVAASRDALLQYGDSTGAGIDTPALKSLREIAEQHGGVAKPSGAGGGDCGIVLSDRHAKIHRILTEWEAAGLLPLELNVYSREESK